MAKEVCGDPAEAEADASPLPTASAPAGAAPAEGIDADDMESSSDDGAEYDFDQTRGLFRRGAAGDDKRAAAKMAKQFRYSEPDPHFDPDLDDEDEQWVRDELEIRRRMVGNMEDVPKQSVGDTAATLARHDAQNAVPKEDDNGDASPRKRPATSTADSVKKSPSLAFRKPDAYLSCPCCFELVCMDAAAMGAPRQNIWRALSLPEECAIDFEGAPEGLPKRVVKHLPHIACAVKPKDGKHKRNKKSRSQAPAPQDPQQAAAHPILCGTCDTRVGWFALATQQCYFDAAIPSEA